MFAFQRLGVAHESSAEPALSKHIRNNLASRGGAHAHAFEQVRWRASSSHARDSPGSSSFLLFLRRRLHPNTDSKKADLWIYNSGCAKVIWSTGGAGGVTTDVVFKLAAKGRFVKSALNISIAPPRPELSDASQQAAQFPPMFTRSAPRTALQTRSHCPGR